MAFYGKLKFFAMEGEMMEFAVDFFAGLVGLIHVYIFRMESFAWGRPRTNRTFGVTAPEAQVLKAMAFNQGFYNLFLALAIFAGFIWTHFGHKAEGQILIDYGCFSVFGAAAVLMGSSPKLWRAALIQGGPAIIYGLLRILA